MLARLITFLSAYMHNKIFLVKEFYQHISVTEMGLPKILAILGITLLVLGLVFVFVPATQEVWKPKSYLLVSKTTNLSPYTKHQEFLTYLFLTSEGVRNLKVQGTIKSVEEGTFSFEITNGEVYVKAEGVPEKSFEFPVEPEELRNGLWLKIAPGNTKVSIRIEATWEQKSYAHVLGGLILGGLLGFFGFILLIVAFIIYVIRRPKVTVEIEKRG